MDDRPKKKEVHELKSELELRDSLKRCLLLLKNTTLLSRMPDGGKSIRDRFVALLDHARSPLMKQSSLADEYVALAKGFGLDFSYCTVAKAEGNGDDEESDNATTAAAPVAVKKEEQTEEEGDDAKRHQLPPDQQDQQRYTSEQVSTYGMATILANRAVRGDIHKELQRMYASNLSQHEIRRLTDASSPYLLMSYDDTLAMEQRFAELEKQAMMRRIKERLLAAQGGGGGGSSTGGGGADGTGSVGSQHVGALGAIGLGDIAEEADDRHNDNEEGHDDDDDGVHFE